MSSSDKNGGSGRGTGPCGACKFLRRKCMMEGCIFAPYFDTDQGTAHFAAVHKVFGASNASKLLMRIPAHKRLDAVVSISYEALARVRDPVYGCVGHIFTLQQQVVNLQEELAYIQARLSSFHCLPLPPPQPAQTLPTADLQLLPLTALNSNMSMHFDSSTPVELVSLCDALNQEIVEDGDLQALSRELVSKYWPAVKFQ